MRPVKLGEGAAGAAAGDASLPAGKMLGHYVDDHVVANDAKIGDTREVWSELHAFTHGTSYSSGSRGSPSASCQHSPRGLALRLQLGLDQAADHFGVRRPPLPPIDFGERVVMPTRGGTCSLRALMVIARSGSLVGPMAQQAALGWGQSYAAVLGQRSASGVLSASGCSVLTCHLRMSRRHALMGMSQPCLTRISAMSVMLSRSRRSRME